MAHLGKFGPFLGNLHYFVIPDGFPEIVGGFLMVPNGFLKAFSSNEQVVGVGVVVE